MMMRFKVSIKVQGMLEYGIGRVGWITNEAHSLIELDRDTMDALAKHLLLNNDISDGDGGFDEQRDKQNHAEVVDFIGDAVHEKLEKLEWQRAEEERKGLNVLLRWFQMSERKETDDAKRLR